MTVKLGLPNHDIAAQTGWSEAAVEAMVKTYAHRDRGLERIKAAATADNVVPLRPVETA
jgi:hypothetical protein